jgi:hypothetical protein
MNIVRPTWRDRALAANNDLPSVGPTRGPHGTEQRANPELTAEAAGIEAAAALVRSMASARRPAQPGLRRTIDDADGT